MMNGHFSIGKGVSGEGTPARTCLGCGRKTSKAALVRLVVSAGALVVDTKGRLPGRGVYCCRTVECWRRFVKQRKKLAWALRCQDETQRSALAALPGFDVVIGAGTDAG